jgi:chemotaxis protein MotB
MAKEKQMIVIKKITINSGGHHGGAWKVAFADFMTAMMAFFLCMWLLSISPEARQSISDYFSTPSVIEYNFRNFGVELTLEKLFADLLNEPLDAVAKLFEPMDKSPNVFEFGNDKIALAYIIDKLGDEAKNVEITQNEINFVIPDFRLFKTGSAEPSSDFLSIMIRVRQVVSGLLKAKIRITSQLFLDGVKGSSAQLASEVATERLDLVQLKVKEALEHESTKIQGFIDVKDRNAPPTAKSPLTGFIRFEITRFVDGKISDEVEKQTEKEETMDTTKTKNDLYDELSDSFRQEVRKKDK